MTQIKTDVSTEEPANATALDDLSGLLAPLDAYLDRLSAQERQVIVQRLVEPDTTQTFLRLQRVSRQLHRLLTGVFSQAESLGRDDLATQDQEEPESSQND